MIRFIVPLPVACSCKQTMQIESANVLGASTCGRVMRRPKILSTCGPLTRVTRDHIKKVIEAT